MTETQNTDWTKDPTLINKKLLRTDISVLESQELYRQWAVAGTYDQVIKDPKTYSALNALMNGVRSVVTDKNALFLDIGAGTGLSGQVLRDIGYTNLHALEPQTNLAELARTKGLYSKVLEEFIGGNTPVSAPDDTYDAIVSTGAFGPGHIPCSAIPEAIRLVKPGGYVIICMRETYLATVPEYKNRMEPLWNKLEEEKKWKLVSRTRYEKHYQDYYGLCIIYQVC